MGLELALCVWSLLLALLQPICGTDARKGLSIAHYATIVGLADAPRPRTSSLQTPVRTIDAHFADLFGLYAGFHVPLREAA